jgi:hypothetical protein
VLSEYPGGASLWDPAHDPMSYRCDKWVSPADKRDRSEFSCGLRVAGMEKPFVTLVI